MKDGGTGGQRQSEWWMNDMAGAGQSLFGQPEMALEAATVPDEVLSRLLHSDDGSQQPGMEERKKKRSGFFGSILDTVGSVDQALTNTFGWVYDMPKQAILGTLSTVGTAYHHVWSEAVSQPLSTAFLQFGKIGTNPADIFNPTEWTEAYGKAEHISPGQAMVNSWSTFAARVGINGDFTKEEKAEFARSSERFLYDTEFWRAKNPDLYKYTSGGLDLLLNIAADPLTYVTAGVGTAVKATRGIELAETVAKQAAAKKAGKLGKLTQFGPASLGEKTARAFVKPKTVDQAIQSKHMQGALDSFVGKSEAEIRQHPMWGKGRRKVDEDALSNISHLLASSTREEMDDIMRVAMNDAEALQRMTMNSRAASDRLGTMLERKVHLDEGSLVDDALITTALDRVMAGRAPLSMGEGLSKAEKLEMQAAEKAAADVMRIRSEGFKHVRNADTAAEATKTADELAQAGKWNDYREYHVNVQYDDLALHDNHLERFLQANYKAATDDIAGAGTHSFGAVQGLHRMGWGGKGAAKTFDRRVQQLGIGKGAFRFTGMKGGYFHPMVRAVQLVGDRLPENFIVHDDGDAVERFTNWVRNVPDLTPEVRADMINQYARGTDKVDRSKIMKQINARVMQHLVSRVEGKGIDPSLHEALSELGDGISAKTLEKFTGKQYGKGESTDQMFSALEFEGKRVDMVEDGEGLVFAPIARSQLSNSDILLPVNDIMRTLHRHSGALQALKQGGGALKDGLTLIADAFSQAWRVTTLIRPIGYAIKSITDEQILKGIKQGWMSLLLDGSKGSRNFIHNRHQWFEARVLGKGAHTRVSARPGELSKTRIGKLDFEGGEMTAQLPTEKFRASHGYFLASKFEADQAEKLARAEKRMGVYKSKREAGEDVDEELFTKLEDEIASRTSNVKELKDYREAIMRTARDSKGRHIGGRGESFMWNGERIPGVYSGEWAHPISMNEITSERALEALIMRKEAMEKGILMRNGSWKTVSPDDPDYYEAYLRSVNLQLGNDKAYRILASDPTGAKMRQWIHTAEGKKWREAMGVRGRYPDDTIRTMQHVLDTYLPRESGLQAKFGRHEDILEDEIRALHPDTLPHVNGEEIKLLTKRHRHTTAGGFLDQVSQDMYHRLGTIPSDIMSRSPIYARQWEIRMRGLMDDEIALRAKLGQAQKHAGNETFTPKELEALYKKADIQARKDTMTMVYDPKRSKATEGLRFMTAFFGSHVDGLQRWGGMLAEKPQLFGTVSKIYNAPVSAGMVTDRFGNQVGKDGHAIIIDENGNITKGDKVDMKDRTLTIRLPGDAQIAGVNSLPLGMSMLNNIAPGDPFWNPSSGPLLQYGLSKLAMQSPRFGEFLEAANVFQYGVKATAGENLAPSILKNMWSTFIEDPDAANEMFQQTFLSELQRQQAAAYTGGPPVNEKQAKKNAKTFMFFKTMLTWLSPTDVKANPMSASPYQFLMDEYKQLQQLDAKNADHLFLAKHGADLYAFTADLTKSNKVADTIEADELITKYHDLLDADPDMLRLLIPDGGFSGTKSSAVRAKQFHQYLGGKAVRERVTVEDAMKQAESKAGRQKYNNLMDQLNNSLLRSGFTRIDEPGAEQFMFLRKQIEETVKAENPAWWESKMEARRKPMQTRIDAMKRILADERVMSDPMRTDLHTLADYLGQREALQAELRARGDTKVSFDDVGRAIGDNEDIGWALRNMQLELVNNNLLFGDIFNEFLEDDDLS